MNDFKISKIIYYSIQDILYHLGVTDKWKYLEALKYKKKRQSNSLYTGRCAFSMVNFEFLYHWIDHSLKDDVYEKWFLGGTEKDPYKQWDVVYEYCMKAYNNMNKCDDALLNCCTQVDIYDMIMIMRKDDM